MWFLNLAFFAGLLLGAFFARGIVVVLVAMFLDDLRFMEAKYGYVRKEFVALFATTAIGSFLAFLGVQAFILWSYWVVYSPALTFAEFCEDFSRGGIGVLFVVLTTVAYTIIRIVCDPDYGLKFDRRRMMACEAIWFLPLFVYSAIKL